MTKIIETNVDKLIPDDKNFNKGTEYGQHLIEESLRNFYRDWETDRKSTRLNSSHSGESRMPTSA